MTDRLYPYHAWIGIDAKGRPPDCCQLLGLRPFESDAETITATVEARVDKVKPFLDGAYAEVALNETFLARNRLVRPASQSRASQLKQRSEKPFWRSQCVQIVVRAVGCLLIASAIFAVFRDGENQVKSITQVPVPVRSLGAWQTARKLVGVQKPASQSRLAK